MTLGAVGTWAYSRINRPDKVGDALEAARDVYVLLTNSVPFDRLKVISDEMPLTSGSSGPYSLASVTKNTGSALTIGGIISVRLSAPNGMKRRLRRSHARVYDSLSNIQASTPATYCRFGNSLEVMPPPSTTGYTYRIRCWEVPIIPVSPDDYDDVEMLLDPGWEELAKWETLYRMYILTEQHDKAALLTSQITPMPRQPSPQKTRVFEMGIIPRLWNDLLKTIDQREAADEDFTVNPQVRKYTHG